MFFHLISLREREKSIYIRCSLSRQIIFTIFVAAAPVITPISKLFNDTDRVRNILMEWSARQPKIRDWTLEDVDALLGGTLKPTAVSPAVLLSLARNPDTSAICKSNELSEIFQPLSSSSSSNQIISTVRQSDVKLQNSALQKIQKFVVFSQHLGNMSCSPISLCVSVVSKTN